MRVIVRSLAGRVGLTGLVGLLLAAVAWWPAVDTAATEQVESGLKRALLTFAAARAANGVISVIQETTVSGSLVVGVSAQPGQILDPLNDLVEQFSTVMLAASVSFGLQRLLIPIGGHWMVALALVAVFLAWVGFAAAGRAIPVWMARTAAVLLLVRFAVPIAALGSEEVHRHFLSPEYQRTQQALDASVSLISMSAEPRAGDAAPSLASPLQWLQARKDELARALDALKSKADAMIRNIVTLIAIFVLQTIILPLSFLGASAWIIRLTFARQAAASGRSAQEARAQSRG